jgi:hypothetical protein
MLEKGFKKKHRRLFLLFFNKSADDVNWYGEDGSGVLLRGNLR